METALKEEKQHDIDKYKDEIKELLLVEIVSRYYYQKGKLEAALKDDPITEEAIRVLSTPTEYASILNPITTGNGNK